MQAGNNDYCLITFESRLLTIDNFLLHLSQFQHI